MVVNDKNSLLRYNIKSLYIPIKVLSVYLFSTIALYFLGPVKWNIDNGIQLCLYLVINYICIIWGYRNRVRREKWRIGRIEEKEYKYRTYWIRFFFVFAIVSQLIYSFYIYGGISIAKTLNMAQSYLDNRVAERHNNLFTKIITYLWGINYCYLPCGIIFHKRLNKLDKLLFVAALITNVLFWLSIGTMKGIGDIVFTALIPLLAVSLKENVSVKEMLKKIKRNKRTILVLVGGAVCLFGYSSAKRYALRGHITFSAINKQLLPFVLEEKMWPLAEITNSVAVYLTHGYTGLAYAMKLPFKWTYFIGNSRALTSIIERTFDINFVSSITYCQRLQETFGWANGSIWPSAFTWLASDFSFAGLPLVMFMVSSLWAKAVFETIIDKNVWSLIYSSYLTLFFVYLPMNNQIVQSERSLYTFILLTIIYIFNSGRLVLTIGSKRIRW